MRELILEDYWQAVSARVCVKCIDSDRYGNCRLSNDQDCGLKVHFPKIVETVLSVKSDRIEPYLEALRANVCHYCVHQSSDGTCSLRKALDCGLDRYFPMIVDAIEQVQVQTVHS